jgi:hypothetical protein
MSTLLEQASLVMIPSGYKEDIVYSQIPTTGAGDLSFTRASNGTRINSAGLVEVTPWNLFGYSETFNNGYWDPSLVTITANSTIAPNGTLTADTFVSTGTTSEHRVRATTNMLGSSQYFVSIYVKKVDVRYAYIRDLTNNTASIYDLQDGVVSTSTGTSTSITQVGDFYLITMSFITPSTIVNNLIDFGMTISPSTFSSLVPSSSSMIFWGAQLNIGSTAKPYFPTTDRLNVPRLTYQNGGGGCPSLLLEKQSTNVALWSEDYSNAVWNKVFNAGGTYPVVTANYGISPDGTQNADRIQLARTTTSNSYSIVYQTLNGATSGQTYTWSVWLKSLSGTPTIGIAYDGAGYNNTVTLTTEWQRHYLSTTATGTLIEAEFLLYQAVAATSLTADFLAWGFQLEASSYPTSYIPTTSASATRVADACSKTGISSLIGQTEGVLFIDFVWNQLTGTGSYPRIIEAWNDGNNYIQLFNVAGSETVYYEIANGGAIQFSGNTTMNLGRNKLALAYKLNDCVFYKNGFLIASDTSATIPSTNDLGVCGVYNGTSGAQLSASVNQAILFPTRLTNSELASLTTI